MRDSLSKPTKSQRTRAAILRAAQELFAELGYERTTVRDIGARASIDPAMVMRYFGSKDELFARATAFDLKLPDLTRIKPTQFGQTLVRHFLELWEGSLSNGSLTILLRASASNDDAAAKMRTIFGSQVMPMLAQVTARAELPTRAGLVSSQLLGLALCRYVLKVPPVVAMPPEQVIRWIGPTLQRYITGKLEAAGRFRPETDKLT
jgi:AcrR family transcriptional regulator